jgi:GEVED domain
MNVLTFVGKQILFYRLMRSLQPNRWAKLKWIFLVFLLGAGLSKSTAQDVLFIGNSYIGFNDLDQMWTAMSWQDGFQPKTTRRIIGGARLSNHAIDTTTLALLSQHWDILIIQPNGIETARVIDSVLVNTLPYLRILDSLARLQNSCLRTIIYQPFNHKLGVSMYCPEDPLVCEYEGAAQRTIESTDQMSLLLNMPVARVGEAFLNHYVAGNNLELWDDDLLHPSYDGSFLAAAVLFQTVFGRSASLNPWHGGLSPGKAQSLKNVAKSTMNEAINKPTFIFDLVDTHFDTNIDGQALTVTTSVPDQHTTHWVIDDLETPGMSSVSTAIYNFKSHDITLTALDEVGCLVSKNKRTISHPYNSISAGNAWRLGIESLQIGNFSAKYDSRTGSNLDLTTGPKAYPGQTLSCTFNPISLTEVDFPFVPSWIVWIDYDRNGAFTPNERLSQMLTGFEVMQTSITLPQDIELGDYPMRVRLGNSNDTEFTNPDAVYFEGDTKEFSILVEAVICQKICSHEIFALQISPSVIQLTWPNATTLNQYVLEYASLDAPISEWSTKKAYENRFTFFADTTASGYRFRVKPVCLDQADVGFSVDWIEVNRSTSLTPCSKPVTPLVYMISDAQAEIYWAQMDEVLLYKLRFRPVGQSVFFEVNHLESFSALLNNLTPNSQYEVSLSAFCLQTNTFTEWSDPVFFLSSRQINANNGLIAYNYRLGVFPNPSSTVLTLSTIGADEVLGQLTITSLVGQIVYDQFITLGKNHTIIEEAWSLTDSKWIIRFCDLSGQCQEKIWVKGM